jgi:hypothetical protein
MIKTIFYSYCVLLICHIINLCLLKCFHYINYLNEVYVIHLNRFLEFFFDKLLAKNFRYEMNLF